MNWDKITAIVQTCIYAVGIVRNSKGQDTMKVLHGHTSPETAYNVSDYPYGFRLRCEIRYWLEYKKGHGYRLMSQTSNPKRAGLVWNKPKGSTYSTLGVMYLDEEDHVHMATLHVYDHEDKIDAFVSAYGEGLQGEREQGIVQALRAYDRAQKRFTYRAISGEELREREAQGERFQTIEEQNDAMRQVAMVELHKLRNS